MSERRIEQMINPKQGELPVKYLVKDAGTNSGFMVAHVTASALASENKALSFPASVDSITTSGGQEDFVSMAMWAARKLKKVVSNTEKVVAVELLAAAQAVDMQERRLKLGKGTLKVYSEIRKNIPALVTDRVMYKDIEKMLGLMRSGLLVA
jgi:histidine ammonia-lyase